MPQIPYNPVPDVTPTQQGPGPMRINTPGAAFGETIAQAVQSVGGDLDKVGGEMFSRAMAIQELNNRADADTAIAQLNKTAGTRWEQFKLQQGQNATKGLDDYTAGLEQDRTAGGQGLNPMAKRYYESESRGLVSRLTVYGAGHAGQQAKTFQTDSAKAVLAQNAEGVAAKPDDEALFQKKLDAVPGLVATQSSNGGWSQEQNDHEIFTRKSELWREKLVSLSKTNPALAKQQLTDNTDKLEYKDWKVADAQIHEGLINNFSRVAADNIHAGWDWKMKPDAVNRAAGVQEPLIRIIQQAQRDNPDLHFTIPDKGGVRTQAVQDDLVRQGFSQTRHSAHLEGRAIDLAPMDAQGNPNFNDKEGYAKIETAMKAAAEKLGIPLSGEHDQIKSWDPGHYSLPKGLNPSTIPEKVPETERSMVARARVAAREGFPNDADVGGMIESRVQSRIRDDYTMQRDENFRNNSTVDNAILGDMGGPDGRKPTNLEDLRAMGVQVSDAFDKLPPDKKRQKLRLLAENAKDDYVATPENFKILNDLIGMAETDPAAFLDTDIPDLKIPRQWRARALQLQIQKQKSAEQDPRITHALQVLGPTLQNAQVTPSLNKDRHMNFVGALWGQLQVFQHDHKRPPTGDEIKQIGNDLLLDQSTHWYQPSNREFEASIPYEKEKMIREDLISHGITPSDEMIRKYYLAKRFQELHGQKATPAPNNPNQPPSPNVPQSQ